MSKPRLCAALATLIFGLTLAACTHETEAPKGPVGPASSPPAGASAPVVTAPPTVTAPPIATPPPAVTPPVVTAPPPTSPPVVTAPPAITTPPPVPALTSQCVLKGSQPIAKGTVLYDAASGGRAIAEFSGAIVPLQMSEIPFDPSASRAKLATSSGGAGVRLEGYIAPSAVTVFTVKDVPVAAGHLWIADGRVVKLTAATSSQLTGEITISGSQSQSAKGSAGCESFALQKGSVTTFTVPGNGRGYQMSASTLDLYDDAGGASIFTLNMADSSDRLFWSTETKSGFVHLLYRGDIVVDAWAKSSALNALKKGEMMDQAIPGQTMITGAQLALDKPPPLRTATKTIPIRARRDEKEKPIGVIEVGAEIYVTETMAGWSNILPKHLGMMPPAGNGFWILSSDVP